VPEGIIQQDCGQAFDLLPAVAADAAVQLTSARLEQQSTTASTRRNRYRGWSLRVMADESGLPRHEASWNGLDHSDDNGGCTGDPRGAIDCVIAARAMAGVVRASVRRVPDPEPCAYPSAASQRIFCIGH
jgi:hypothetical protein